MISVDNISVRFGGVILLERVSIQVGDRDRIGLVGRNGAGKTTLLRIISGLQEPTEGKVVISNEATIGYLPQQMRHMDGKTVYDEAVNAFEEILAMEEEINSLNIQLGEREDYDSPEYMKIIEDLTTLNEQFEMHGGSSLHADVERTLIGLGFTSSDMDRPTSEFSGGWRMRIEIAKILLKKPDFILLDEPTNHLDIESIQWIEDYLSNYSGGVIIISHDRAFLDKFTNRTIEISLAKLIDYRLPYSKYVEFREEQRDQEVAAFDNQQKMIKDTEDFIERFRYKATKAVQVQSRVKQLEKLKRIEIEDRDFTEMNVKFPPSPRSGRVVCKTENLTKSYGNNVVLKEVDFVIERGEKVAFVGKNGEGKTTLMKIIAGLLDYEGELKRGQNLSGGYFAQNQDELLDENKTVFETLDLVATGDMRTKVRDILGAFLFSGEDVDKKVRVLSGGERSRLSLALMLLERNNLLLMDEPTNHLDMRSKDILKIALTNYDGTLIVVSHDRDFLDGLVDKVYEFKNNNLREHLGGIQQFLERRKLDSLNELEKKVKPKLKAENPVSVNSLNKQRYEGMKEIDRKLRKLENKLTKHEKEIEVLEAELENMNTRLTEPENIENDDLFNSYGKVKKKIDMKMKEWETVHIELENLKEERF